jgi:hypothetical protein
MSGIPSDIAGSSLQAGYQAREAARARDGAKTAQATGASRQAQAINESHTSVDTSDEGTQVYSDAEGTGGQGRTFEEEQTEQPNENPDTGGGDTGEDTDHRLDIQA